MGAEELRGVLWDLNEVAERHLDALAPLLLPVVQATAALFAGLAAVASHPDLLAAAAAVLPPEAAEELLALDAVLRLASPPSCGLCGAEPPFDLHNPGCPECCP